MKIRIDYVTNSSSSSFVVGFKDEESIEEQLRCEMYAVPRFDTILNDVKRNRITKAEALHTFRDEMYWDAEYALEHEYERKGIGSLNFYDWIKDHRNREEFYEKVNERLDVWFEEFKQKIEGFDYLALVEYDDHCDGDLEHEIMPRLGCTIQRFSHH